MSLRQATLVLLRTDESILLAMKKRGFGIGKWNGVGGKPEPGEAIEQTAIRECQEEIGVTPIKLHEVARLDFYYQANPDWDQQVVVYTCRDWTGEPTESEEMKPQWYALPDIPYADMWPDDREWLPRVLAGSYVTATFTFDNANNLVAADVHEKEIS